MQIMQTRSISHNCHTFRTLPYKCKYIFTQLIQFRRRSSTHGQGSTAPAPGTMGQGRLPRALPSSQVQVPWTAEAADLGAGASDSAVGAADLAPLCRRSHRGSGSRGPRRKEGGRRTELRLRGKKCCSGSVRLRLSWWARWRAAATDVEGPRVQPYSLPMAGTRATQVKMLL